MLMVFEFGALKSFEVESGSEGGVVYIRFGDDVAE